MESFSEGAIQMSAEMPIFAQHFKRELTHKNIAAGWHGRNAEMAGRGLC